MSDYSQTYLDRLSLSRPGSRLLEIVPCAIPIFLVKADVLLIERRPVGPVEEFVLKAIDQGFVVPAEISGILGLEEELIIETLVGLQREDLVFQVVRGGMREMRLTTRGAEILEGRLRESPARAQIRIGFDRLTWDVSAAAQGHLLRRTEMVASGLKELRPFQKRRVRTTDLSIDSVEKEVRSLRARAFKPTVLAIESIVRADRFFLAADVAIFEPLDGGRPQLSVLIDRRPSEQHESALERLGGLDVMEAEVGEPAPSPMEALARDYGEVLAEELAQSAPTAEQREQIRLERIATSGEEPEGAPVAGTPVGIPSLPTVQFIDTFEHRPLLQEALTTSKRRLVILSPWITAKVVNAGFLEQLSQLLRKGVRVHIGYGLEQRPGDRPVAQADEKAEAALATLATRFSNFTFVKLGNTHSKQLLFDDTHISGSFNWLSFQGDARKQYRHEESTVVRRKDLVDAKYTDLCERIEAALDDD